MNKLINDTTFTNIKGWRWKYDNFDYMPTEHWFKKKVFITNISVCRYKLFAIKLNLPLSFIESNLDWLTFIKESITMHIQKD